MSTPSDAYVAQAPPVDARASGGDIRPMVGATVCPECFPDNPAARERDRCREHSKTPMERDYPALCEWVRHGCVRLDNLRDDLRRALAFVGEEADR